MADPAGVTVPIHALDWPLAYWQSGRDEGSTVDFVCNYQESKSVPDRRCKGGVRTWMEPCYYFFREWDTLRDLLRDVTCHIAQAHSGITVRTDEES
jgi:hypothetical protein